MATINVLPEGFLFGDRYRIIRLIGQGGMGVVYLVKDTQLDGEIRAVKTIKPELLNDPKGAVRMKREAIASMKLTHPNIIRIFNYEEWQGMAFIVMEYVDGHTLAHLLAEKDKVTEEEFFPLANQLLDALKYAHSRQIIHQDIKPANIFLNSDGTPKLADFGIAKVLNDTATRLTGNFNPGTILYMAPELLKGEKPSEKSDLYALGITFYEMLAGDPPFVHGDIFRMHFEVDPPKINDISPGSWGRIQAMLSKSPDQRSWSESTESHNRHKTTNQTESPMSSGEFYQKGVEEYDKDNYKQALELFTQALQLDPDLEDMIRPDISRCEKNIKLAEEKKKKQELLAKEKGRIPVYLINARRQLEANRPVEACELYAKVLAIEPDNSEAASKKAEIEADLQRQEEERKKARQATLAETREKEDKLKKSKEEYYKSLKGDTGQYFR